VDRILILEEFWTKESMDPRSFVETDELTAQVLAGKTLKSQNFGR